MSAGRRECCSNSSKYNRTNCSPSQHDFAAENLQNMWSHYNCWWNYQHAGRSRQENNCTTWCITCFEEQKMREERVKTLKNRDMCTSNTAASHSGQTNRPNRLLSDYYSQPPQGMNGTCVEKLVCNVNAMPPEFEGISATQYEDNDNDEFEMELNNDFRKFLEQSARHKEQRKKEAERARAETDDYIEVNEIALEATTLVPTQQQGVLRTQEMKALYGKSAHHIESIETSLQLHFNMNVDMRHPVFWPSIPLKF